MAEIESDSVKRKIELFEAIDVLREEMNAVILAHYYQEGAIQDIADYVGDSLALSRHAARTDADVIVFAGVHFMAETAKILNPDKQVLLPDLEAGCSLSDGCPADELAVFKADHPGHKLVSYINCTAAVKAISDMVCTSSNATRVVDSFGKNQPVILAPDRFLGAWVAKELGRELVLWPGSCEVHEQFNPKKLKQLKLDYPAAVVAAHPECPPAILDLADHVGSTTGILKFARESDAAQIIVVTEAGILHQMRKENPDKELIPAPGPDESCGCNECAHMKKNTLQKLYRCMLDRTPEVVIPEEIRKAALRPIERMLALG